jgi:hypothetical protein
VNKKDLPVIPSDRADDLHGLEIADKAELVLFMAGNQFMAMKEIVAEFKARYSEVKNIFYETLPPGLELKQILAGGAIFQNKAFNIYPDVYSSVNRAAMQLLEKEGHIVQSGYHMYLHNRLTLMVPRGNPAQVKSVGDLARGDVRISQPDPQNEDIAYHIRRYCLSHHGYVPTGRRRRTARSHHGKKAGGRYNDFYHCPPPRNTVANCKKDRGRRTRLGN